MAASGEVFFGHWRGSEIAVKQVLTSAIRAYSALPGNEKELLEREDEVQKRIPGYWPKAPVRPSVFDNTSTDIAILAYLKDQNTSNDGQHVVQLLEYFRGPELSLVFMKDAGENLYYDILSRSQLDAEKAKLYCRQILDAARYLHSKNVAHRDISLDNCLVKEEGTLRLCHFGQACLIKSPQRVAYRYFHLAGKLHYRAPECMPDLHGGEGYLAAPLDVWACGILIFVMLYRRRPWAGALPDDADYLRALRYSDMTSALATMVSMQEGHQAWPPDEEAVAKLIDSNPVLLITGSMLEPAPANRPSMLAALFAWDQLLEPCAQEY